MLERALAAAAASALAVTGAASALALGGSAGAATSTTSTTATTPTATTPTVTTSTARTTLVLNGRGWGHGIGMSQWGANGFAQRGWTYDRILAHYYRGTTLGPAPVSKVRVLLVEGAKKLVLGSATAWRVVDAEGTRRDLAPRTLTLTPALRIDGEPLTGPLTFATRGGPLTGAGKTYRGTMIVSVEKEKLRLVNVLGLEAYLKGVVGSEMPSEWPAEALKAQAVAARSYAVANLAKGRGYDLYSDVRSQVYRGVAAEASTTSAAIDATAKQVVLYAGKVATTYFFSTSGGRTVSHAEVTGRPVPYLQSVADPYDTASPHHVWGPVLLDGAKVTKQLRLKSSITDLRIASGPSGRVATATAVTALGETSFSGTQLRAQLELRSTWFTVGWLSLTPPKTVTYGGAGILSGVARGVGAVTLESRPTGGLWQSVGAVSPDAAGRISTVVRPQLTTEYRLAAGTARAAAVKVPVAPLVRAADDGTTATGTIRPPTPGAAVQLQRQVGTAWTTVATGVTDAAGAFAIAGGAGEPGTYRVRVAPGRGLVPGFSQPIVR